MLDRYEPVFEPSWHPCGSLMVPGGHPGKLLPYQESHTIRVETCEPCNEGLQDALEDLKLWY